MHVPLARRAEAWMVSVGYLDRVVLVTALVLAGVGEMTPWIPFAYLGITAVEVGWAIVRAGAGRHLALIFGRTAAFFPLDVVATIVATAAHLAGASNGATPWRPPARGTPDP